MSKVTEDNNENKFLGVEYTDNKISILQDPKNLKDNEIKELVKVLETRYSNQTAPISLYASDIKPANFKKILKSISESKVAEHIQGLRSILYSNNLSDDNLPYLKNFSNLKELNLSFTKVTNEVLKHLPGSIEKLKLSSCENIKDEHLPLFKNYRNLRYLNIAYTQITGKVLQYLQNSIEELDLSDCKNISVEDFKYLKNRSNLKVLQLNNTEITGECLKHLPKNIEALNLQSCNSINAEDLGNLKNYSNLKVLTLPSTEITAEALKNLPPNLEYLNTYGTKISDNEVKELKKQNPKLKIDTEFFSYGDLYKKVYAEEKDVVAPSASHEQNEKVDNPISTHDSGSNSENQISHKEIRKEKNQRLIGEYLNDLNKNETPTNVWENQISHKEIRKEKNQRLIEQPLSGPEKNKSSKNNVLQTLPKKSLKIGSKAEALKDITIESINRAADEVKQVFKSNKAGYSKLDEVGKNKKPSKPSLWKDIKGNFSKSDRFR